MIEKIKEKMTKVARKKKWRKIRIWILLSVLFLLILPPIVITIPSVQTSLVQRITVILSERLNAVVEIKSVNIRFFNRVVLNGVCVRDLDNDTLLYVRQVEAGIGKLPLNTKVVQLNKVKLSDGFFRLSADSTGTNVVRIFRSGDDDDDDEADTTASDPMRFVVKALELRNFSYGMKLRDYPTVEEQPDGIIYKNMSVSNIYLDADRVSLHNDTLLFRVNSFSFRERSGFNVRRMSADTGFIRFGREVRLKEFRLIDDFSVVKMKSLSMTYNGGEAFSDFLDSVHLVLDIYDSRVDFKTIGFFAPVLKDVSIAPVLNAKIEGSVSNFRSDNFEIRAPGNTVMNGRFSISGLPDAESMMIFADLKYFYIEPADAAALPAMLNVDFKYADLLAKAGKMNFVGTFTGFFTDFVSTGYLWTELGDLKLDLMLNSADDGGKGFRGSLAAMDFDAGKLADIDNLGKLDCNVVVDGSLNGEQSRVLGKGVVSHLDFNGYGYSNVEIDGDFADGRFTGKVNVSDPNLELSFKGNIDAAGEDGMPVFDFEADLRHADLVRLNFNRRDSVGILAAKVDANFRASNILNYVGDLTVGNISYRDNLGIVNTGDVVLSSFKSGDKNYINLKSDIVDAVYFGRHDPGDFAALLIDRVSAVLPDLFDAPVETPGGTSLGDYDFTATVKNLNEAARIAVPGLALDKADLKITVDTNSIVKIKFDATQLAYGDLRVDNLRLDCSGRRDTVAAKLSGDLIVGGATIENLNLDNRVFNNVVETTLSFNDYELNSGAEVFLRTVFERKPAGLTTAMELTSGSSLTLFGRKWNVEPATARIGNSRLTVRDFNLNHEGQELLVSGEVSSKATDTLLVKVNKLNLAWLNPYIANRGYSLSGNMSGEVELTGLYGIPLVIGDIAIDTVIVNRDTLGGLALGSMWDNELQRLSFAAHLFRGKTINKMDGYILPSGGEINADLDVRNVELRLLEPLLSGILSDVNGSAEGKVSFAGTLSRPRLSGEMRLKNAGLTVDYLKTRYVVNSSIDISDSKFMIRNGTITDRAGNSGSLNLDLSHNYFSDIKFNASANVRNFESLNTGEKDNPLFYGSAYATGVVNMKGNARKFEFSVTAETDARSRLYIPLPSLAEAKEYDFLTFAGANDGERPAQAPPSADRTGMSLDFDLSVTPQSEIQILIDPKVNDILKAKGSGNLKIKVDPSIDLFSIMGDYSIESGEYNFTLPNFSIISRKFLIDNGSSIHFDGNISRAVLDVTASYRERVSIAPLFPQDSSRYYPVICKIMITGKMANPKLQFNVEIQDIGPEKNAQFKSIVNNDEKMAKQFVSILVLKSFYPEQNFATADIGSTSLMSNASELLSAQLGNLISLFKLPVPIDFRFDYNANSQYSNAGADFEFDIGIQLSDRIILNGRAGNATHSNRNFVGDFDLELLLDKQGNTRFKVFSKSKDYFSDDMESNRNGIGILYRSQFDSFMDLFRKKKKKRTDDQN